MGGKWEAGRKGVELESVVREERGQEGREARLPQPLHWRHLHLTRFPSGMRGSFKEYSSQTHSFLWPEEEGV